MASKLFVTPDNSHIRLEVGLLFGRQGKPHPLGFKISLSNSNSIKQTTWSGKTSSTLSVFQSLKEYDE